MSRLRTLLLSSTLLLSTLTATACSPATSRPASTSTATTAVVTPVQRAEPAPDRATLRAALVARREQNVARFLAYRDAMVYPVNSYDDSLQHVWIDEVGSLCAAATLISADWGREATAAVGYDNNFIRLADVSDGALHDWMLTSGLAKHELVAIQEPMMPPAQLERQQEITRLHAIYTSVERQLRSLWDDNLDEAVDALLANPALARRFVDGTLAGNFTTAPTRT